MDIKLILNSTILFVVTSIHTVFASNIDLQRHIKIQIEVDGFKPWDPRESATGVNAFKAAVHTQPLYFTREHRVKSGYIKNWSWNYKKKLYVFKIDRSYKFHDGRPIEARDFEFALINSTLAIFLP